MSQESDYDNLTHDQLLSIAKAKGSSKVLIPKMCAALKRENPNYTNYDIREIVTKGCISIWQKATIRDALPEEYKDQTLAEQGKKGRQKQPEQAGGLVTEGRGCF
jgi:predicted HTH transcriptional regulator